MYTFSYKGIEYKQEGPITKGKDPKITQRKITTTCSNCGKEITLNFSIFRKEVNKKVNSFVVLVEFLMASEEETRRDIRHYLKMQKLFPD